MTRFIRAIVLLFLLALVLSGCSSKPFDPQMVYYKAFCYYPREAAPDEATYGYWQQNCSIAKAFFGEE